MKMCKEAEKESLNGKKWQKTEVLVDEEWVSGIDSNRERRETRIMRRRRE